MASKLSSLSILYRWLNALCDDVVSANVFPLFHPRLFQRIIWISLRLLILLTSVFPPVSLPFALRHTYTLIPFLCISLSSLEFSRTSAALISSSRTIVGSPSLCLYISLVIPCFLILCYALTISIRFVSAWTFCAHCYPRIARLYLSFTLTLLSHSSPQPFHFPVLIETSCRWHFYVAQQRPRKGPLFSSEGVSPRSSYAIATSTPWNVLPISHTLILSSHSSVIYSNPKYLSCQG